MAKSESVTKVSLLSPAQLSSRLAEKRAELAEKKRSLKAGELANPHSLKAVRREIARLLTVANRPPVADQPKQSKESSDA